MSELSMFVVIAIVVIIIAIIAIIGNSISDRSSQEYERPEERAGREGEYIAINIIRRVLRNGDVLLTNVDISYDGTWIKCKTDPYGNTFTKTVRNPIKQVNRQVYLLARHLEEYRFYVWVEGYAFFVQGNSPVWCKEVLVSSNDIDKAVHTFSKNRLSVSDIESIKAILLDPCR